MSMLQYQDVKQAIEKGGSIRKAAKLLGMSYTAVQWWIARNGYRVERKAVLVKAELDCSEQKADRA